MAEKKLGRQTPTISVILPYTETLGGEAIEMYDKSLADRSIDTFFVIYPKNS